MRILKLGFLVALCVAAYAIPLLGSAQPAPANAAPPPPRTEPLEEGEPPAVTIRKPEEQQGTITEKRAPGGRVTNIRVTTGGSTYYLAPNDASGSSLPGDMQSNATRAAQWEVLTFDLGPSKEEKEVEAKVEAATPLPPTAPPPKK